jgi:hypothetical protein
MVGTHGGTIVPPRDDDELSSEGEDGLVAQIIPLRQREHEAGEPSSPAPETLDDRFPSPRDVPLGERSVWDQPTAELRRRGTEADSGTPHTPSTHGASALALRFSRRFLAVAAMATVAATVLALTLGGALQGQPRSAPRHGARRSPQAQSAGGTHRQQPRRQQDGRHRSSSVHTARHAASESKVASSSAGARIEEIRRPPPVPMSAGSSSEIRPQESAPVHAQGTPSPSVSTPSTSQSECVPGELGC